MLRATLDLVDRPAPALAATGGGLSLGWVAKWAASASECASVLAPFAALALADQMTVARTHTGRVLWGSVAVDRATGLPTVQRLAAPADILAEITEADRVKLMLADVAVRLALALRSPDAATAFVTSSPVPATERVDFKDASGDVVDVSPELGALLAKFATITGVEVVTVVHAE